LALPSVLAEGAGAAFRVGPAAAAVAVAVAAGLAIPAGALLIPVAAAAALVLGLWSQRRLGGRTGDTLGAAGELTETAVLVGAAARTRAERRSGPARDRLRGARRPDAGRGGRALSGRSGLGGRPGNGRLSGRRERRCALRPRDRRGPRDRRASRGRDGRRLRSCRRDSRHPCRRARDRTQRDVPVRPVVRR